MEGGGDKHCKSAIMACTSNNDGRPTKRFPLIVEVPIITTKEVMLAENPMNSRYSKRYAVSPLRRLQVKRGGAFRSVGVIVR